ncbi:Collagen alpha-3(VI) chain [Triplophysa tibetana]|uniref:Collagen alpha-3(VI) chain n=1 Tax=Triplophysa tibetana TaxID=1572043 RepID=A0A5A9P526_9TELE|nr:Collagen alpha-3(VI) chain [Triplophysa tibetana]
MGSTLVNAVREFIKKFIDSMPMALIRIPTLKPCRIKPKPSTEVNIGAALDFVRTKMLIPKSGSRIQQRVPQLVLLLTTKKSKDSVQQSAEALRQMGVLTLAAAPGLLMRLNSNK